ncbi:MAG: hypothetical protein WA061_01920 [Microgenomates group bacterium]
MKKEYRIVQKFNRILMLWHFVAEERERFLWFWKAWESIPETASLTENETQEDLKKYIYGKKVTVEYE